MDACPARTMLPFNTQSSITNVNYSRNAIGKTQIRPSSPRHFFARIYGDLENNSNNNNNHGVVSENVIPTSSASNLRPSDVTFTHFPQSTSPIREANYQSDAGSTSSADISISDERVDKNFTTFNTSNATHDYIKPDLNNMLTPKFVGLPFGFPSETPFSAGLTAFLARRRRKEGRQRRQRTTFSNEQTLRLEVEFHRNEYISRSKRFELAEGLGLSETQIKIWFQNRRAKDKRIEKAQIDQQYRNFVVANGFMNSIIGHTATYTPTALQQNFYPQQQAPQINTAIPAHQNNAQINSKFTTSSLTAPDPQQTQIHHNQCKQLNVLSKKLDDSLTNNNTNNVINPVSNYVNINTRSFHKEESFSGSTAHTNGVCVVDGPSGNSCNFTSSKLINSF